jgi:exopolyphosphatase/pppGpp-phosphohydrolase
MPRARAAMLSVALILVDEVLKMANTEEIIVSAFAMKEGMLSELMSS